MTANVICLLRAGEIMDIPGRRGFSQQHISPSIGQVSEHNIDQTIDKPLPRLVKHTSGESFLQTRQYCLCSLADAHSDPHVEQDAFELLHAVAKKLEARSPPLPIRRLASIATVTQQI